MGRALLLKLGLMGLTKLQYPAILHAVNPNSTHRVYRTNAETLIDPEDHDPLESRF